MELLWLLDTQAKSEHSQAYIVLTWGLFGNSKNKAICISMKKTFCYRLSEPLTWAFLHNSPGPVTSNATLKVPSPNVAAKTHTVYLSYKGAYGPAVLPGNLLFKLTLAGCQETKLHVQKSYLRSACGPRLSRWITVLRIYGTTYTRK